MMKSSIQALAHEICDELSEADEHVTRDLLTTVADKWSLWVMEVLATAGTPLRFSRVLERVEGISQKSLTKTLRQLQRDGLVTRTMYLEVPPRVEYAMTPLGLELGEHVLPLWTWVARNVSRFQTARETFDADKK